MRRERACKKIFPGRSRRKHKRLSGRKSSPGGFESFGFTLSLAKSEMGKEVGRPTDRLQDDGAKSRRGDRKASERKNGTGGNERQPVMPRLTAR